MRAIVVGGGQVGRLLAAQLASDGADVRVVERDHGAAQRLAEIAAVTVCCGDGNRIGDLEDAGARGADAVFAVTGSDECNILTAVLAREVLGVHAVYASVNNADNARVYDALDIPHVEPCAIAADAMHELASGNGYRAGRERSLIQTGR